MKKADSPKILGVGVLVLTGLLASCNPTIQPVAAPQNILTIPDDKNVTVLWDAVQDQRVTGYNVYKDGTKVNTSPIAPSMARATLPRRLQFVVSNVTVLSKFTVRAITGSGEGETSPESSSRPVVCSRYLVRGTDMGMQSQNISLTRASAPLSSATVRVNGTNIPFATGIFQGNLPAAVAVGSNLELVSNDGDCVVYARDTLPEKPVVTAPAAAANVSSSAQLPVSWTSATDPDRFVVSATWLEGAGGTGWRSEDLAGSSRSFNIPANTLPSDKSVKIRVYAYNDGTETFIGAFEAGSKLAIRHGDEAGKDITTQPSLPGVSWGDPHLIGFDQTGVEFQAVGEFDLAYSNDNGLRVQARQQPWGGSSVVSINSAIATSMNGQKVGVYLSAAGVSPLRVGNAGTRTTVPSSGLDLGAGFRITQTGSDYTFLYPSGDRMVVSVAGGYINVKIYPASSRASQMKGLLGNFDGNATNDIFKRDGSSVVPFDFANFYGAYANSWRVPSAADSLFVYDDSQAFGGFDNPNFPSNLPSLNPTQRDAARATCEAAGVAANNLENCITDVGQTGDNSFATGAAAQPNPVGLVAPALPDLKITEVRLSLGDVCRPYSAFIRAAVVVQNFGAAASPLIAGIGTVQLVDARDELLGAGYRGNGVELPALAAGASTTVNLDIFYPIATPADTEGLRTYVARVDFGNRIIESDETNNRAGEFSINIPVGHCKNRVAYIHGADASAAAPYQTGLTAKGLRVSTLPISSLTANSTVMLMGYDMIAIDTNTGNLDTWEGDSGVQNAIRTAGRPLIGIGEGGYAYLGKFKSPIGWANGWHQSTGSTTFANPSPSHASQNGPFNVVSSAGVTTVSSSNMPFVAIHLPQVASSLQLVARQADDTTHYISVLNTTPTATTGATEAIWGFKGLPQYTDNGWNSLANLFWFMLP
jgi:von Willebrand factor type D domain/CARDB